jgi:hypothetical protein
MADRGASISGTISVTLWKDIIIKMNVRLLVVISEALYAQ